MKNDFTYTQPRLANLSWYVWLFVVSFASLGNKYGCQINAPDNTSTNNTPPALSLQFEKLSYDRGNNRLVVIIKNIGKETAKDLSLRCTNISQDEESRTTVLFNNTVTTTFLPLPDLDAGASTQEIYVAIDFQTAKEALAQVEITYGQQVTKADSIQICKYPISIATIEPKCIVGDKQGEGECKWKLIVDQHEQSIDFTKFRLEVMKVPGEDVYNIYREYW